MGNILINHEHIKIHGYKYEYLHEIYSHQPKEFFQLQFHFGKQYRLHHDGLLPHNVFWDYLRVKHNLHHKRFDHYHPIVGRWFDKEPSIHHNGIPEPSSIILLGSGLIYLYLLKKWLKKYEF